MALVASRRSIDRFDIERLETAVIELAGNAVEHGRPPGEVVLTLTIAAFDDHVDATLRDNAERFDDDPAEAQLPPELAESGRGLTPAHLSVDSLTHHFDNGNVWTMSRRFTRSHS